ncbi:hypothetical protein NDU88_005074 [Pleurodeles waltl]|uniref:Uncharacterized protein n=1 Tax=Pleurodeles waltl TaxID=8319 RepID=A0AAV7TUB4_PLEWA|nr:hypothetical protein NDU88_005074 [Pleurodeles waltl]
MTRSGSELHWGTLDPRADFLQWPAAELCRDRVSRGRAGWRRSCAEWCCVCGGGRVPVLGRHRGVALLQPPFPGGPRRHPRREEEYGAGAADGSILRAGGGSGLNLWGPLGI